MPQGYSYNRDHFTTFEDGIHTFFDEGFVDKTFTLNASLKTDKAGADLHETFAENPKGLNNKSQNRFWVNVKDDKSVFATLSSDFLSLHYDNGIKTSQSNDTKANFFAIFRSNRAFQGKTFHAGATFFNDKTLIGLKLLYDTAKNNFMISSKGSFTRNHWTFNLFNTFSLTSRAFRKTGILLKHTNAENNSICVMRIMSPEEEKDALASAQIVDRVALNWIKQVDPKTTVGVEIKSQISQLRDNWADCLGRVWLGAEWKFDNGSRLKAKVNSQLSYSLTVTNDLPTYGSYSLGVEASEISSKNKVKFGVQLNLNL